MSALLFETDGGSGSSRDLFIKTMGAVLPNANIEFQSAADVDFSGQKGLIAGAATSECTTARTAESGFGQTQTSQTQPHDLSLRPDQLESETSSARFCALSGGTPEPGTPEWTPRPANAKCSDETKPRESCFDGWWRTGEIKLHISGTNVRGLECEGFRVTTWTTCELVQEGNTYHGTFKFTDEVHWNDGDIWTRCEAPGTSSLSDPPREVCLATVPTHTTPSPAHCPQNVGDGQICKWYRVAYLGGLNLRVQPSVNAAFTGITLPQNEVFAVSSEIDGTDSRVYLRLLDGRGWAFDDSALLPDDPSVVRLPWCPYPGAFDQGSQMNFEWPSLAAGGCPPMWEPIVELSPPGAQCYQ